MAEQTGSEESRSSGLASPLPSSRTVKHPTNGWGRRILIGFGIVVLLFGVFLGVLYIGDPYSVRKYQRSSQAVQSKIPVPTMTPQEIESQAVNIRYDPLYRHIETHVGKLVHLTGKVVQVIIMGDDRYNLRAAMYGNHDQVIYVTYQGDRVLEDDIVEFWGRVKGLYSYESVLGATITLPEINSLKLVIPLRDLQQ